MHAGDREREAAFAEAVTEEAIETSEIESEPLDAAAVRSSVARRLGLPQGQNGPEDVRADGVVALTLDATQNYAMPLTAARLYEWHALLFPLGPGAEPKLAISRFRDDANGPMQVVSGPTHRPRVHFQAPPASELTREVESFIAWFNGRSNVDGLVRAAQAHLWFVTVHPYDDGNGRIARALADMALAQDEASSERFISMSRQIRCEKARYYKVLEQTQKGDLDVTTWIVWFLECYTRAAEHALSVLSEVRRASRFWQAHNAFPFSAREKKVLDRFLHDFEGALTAKKWAAIARISLDTAQRDIANLLEAGVLVQNPGGSKNTSYRIEENSR